MLMRRDQYENRKFVLYAFIVGVGLIFIIRLMFLQIFNDSYKLAAERNTLRNVTIYPPRGLIYDRNGELLVYNGHVFDLMVIPKEIKEFDTLALCKLIGIDKEGFDERLKAAKSYSWRKASIFEKQISKKQGEYLQEFLISYNGFYLQARTLRNYPMPIAAHAMGYIGETSPKHLEKDTFYQRGDYIGISGIEKTYENDLRGQKGVKKLMVDVHNRLKGKYQDGALDKPAINGKNLYTGIDMALQAYGEELMKNKLGAVVAIEPATGEILSFISSPTYDPNLLIGRIRSKNYSELLKNKQKPLLNRAFSEQPPGSTFKLVQALVAQQEGVINPSTTFGCSNGYHAGGLTVGCHSHASPLNLLQSVQQSCNAYYCNVFRKTVDNRAKYKNTEEGYQAWRNYLAGMGFGVTLGIDLPSEKDGNIPPSTYYDKYYGRHHWNSLTIISLAIGQGEVLATPLQLANEAAYIANRGYYYKPHIVRAVGDPESTNANYNEKIKVPIHPRYFDVVIDGMEKVAMVGGTARLAKIDSVSVCGKTGTAQNPHGEDHSVFIAFAPKDNPKIAIAVFVENSGYGGTWAAPIASLMIEQYIKGKISKKREWLEKRMLDGNLTGAAK